MKYSAAIVLASVAAGVSAQGAPSGLKPSGSPPAGCVTSAPGRYAVQNVALMSKRDLEKRVVDCAALKAPLIVTLQNSELHDSAGRIGEIVANRQFQFDGPPAQVGTIYDAGFSMCANGSLAIGSSTVFYQCLSGGFYNIYDQPSGAGCKQIEQQLLMCADSTGSVTAPAATSISSSLAAVGTQSDGQPTASSATTVVSQVSDGQPQATSAVVSQLSDGQPQATSASNATVTTKAPIPTGAAAQYGASGAVAVLGAIAAYLL